jgi:3-methylfumaryl-CoA hydratase
VSEIIERTEILLPGPAYALGSLLGVPVPDLDHGEGLPLLWHWIYLLERPAQADLGPDGHPAYGTIPVPPGPGRRRMWAGGRLRMRGTLQTGETAVKHSSVLSVQEKEGRSGPLTFVVIQHQVLQRGRVVIDEQQDIVYREAASAIVLDSTPERPDGELPVAEDEWQIQVSPTLLFRFSALTYNAHRIHYDRDYTRSVEGYPGLLTHGPLQALAMAEAARADREGSQHDDDLYFEYRLKSPLFDHQGLVVRATRSQEAILTTVRDIYGRQTASGRLQNAGT